MVICSQPPQPKLKTPAPRPRSENLASLPDGDTVAWGDFALGRHKPDTGYSYFQGTHAELLSLVQQHWNERKPGAGRSTLDEVVIVPMPSARFLTTTIEVQPDTQLSAQQFRRRPHEDPYVRVTAEGQPQPARYASVVLYHKDTLERGNERSHQADWEVVSIIASPVPEEPMDPVTMMRNMRGKAGGTQVNYTPEQLLDSIDFWSRHVKIQPAGPHLHP